MTLYEMHEIHLKQGYPACPLCDEFLERAEELWMCPVCGMAFAVPESLWPHDYYEGKEREDGQ